MDLISIIFFGLLIWFLVKFIISPILRVALTINRAKRQARDFFGAYNNMGGREEYYGQNQEPEQNVNKKKIDKNVGEYVEFEELSASETTTTANSTSTRVYHESQVTDVEWEDVK
jgi:hypothetical protein